MKQYLALIFLFIFMMSCNNSTTNPEEGNESETDPVKIVEEIKDNIVNTVDDELEKEKTPLEYHKEYLKATWEDAPNPMIATYEGAELGDYFHLGFTDEAGRGYDFADGSNDFGDYELYDSNYETNKKLEGKKFEIKWDWKLSKFTCCDGAMNEVEAEVPSIVGLKLLD